MLHVLLTTLIQTGFAVERPPVPEGIDLAEPTPAMCRRAAGTPIGLTTSAISLGMNRVLPSISWCFAQELGNLEATLTIGCDGLVQNVEAYDGSGLAPTAIACIMDTLYYASFAPHDVPDGQVVAMAVEKDGVSLYGAGTFKDNSPRATVLTGQQEPQGPQTNNLAQPQNLPTSVGVATASQNQPPLLTTRTRAATSTTCDDVATQQACEGGEDPDACTLWATALLDRSDSCYNSKGARDLLLTICTGVSSPHQACLKLGSLYEEGQGGERDRTKAASYFRWGCRGGNSEACFARGSLLERGIGIQRDDELALVSHEKGCQLGDLRSCFRAATILNEGTFVTRDVRRAANLFQMTCDSGDPDGCLQLGILQQSMRPAEYNAAHTNFEKAIQGGSHEAMRHLARLLWNGFGGKTDKRQAKLLCQEACQLGDPLACRGPQYL
jgi:TPR repeat protein